MYLWELFASRKEYFLSVITPLLLSLPPGPLDTIPRGATAAPTPVKAPITAPVKAPITNPVKGAAGAAPVTAPQTGVQIKQIVKPAETAAQGLGVPGTSKEIKAPGTVTKEKV